MAKRQVEVYFPLLKMSFDCELPAQLKVKDTSCLIIEGMSAQLKTEIAYSAKDNVGCLLYYENTPGEWILLPPEATIEGAGIQDGGRFIIA